MSNTVIKKNPRGRRPVKRQEVILSIREKKRGTSADLDASTAYLDTLVKKNILKIVGKVKHEGRGRPRNLYSLTPSGRGFALNLSKKVA